MNSKVFSQRFNRELAALGLPEEVAEKIKAVAKVFNVTRYLANSLIFGHVTLTSEQLNNIAEILDVCPLWLSGMSDKKRTYARRELVDEAVSN